MVKRLDPANRQAALCAVVLALIVGLITHWPVGAAIGGAVGWTLRSALQPNTSNRVVGRLEALATWIEALRDSVAAHRGLLAAIESTVAGAPAAVKANVVRLVARIKSGVPLDQALHAFALELGDAAVDEAIAPLILASRFGGSDLQSLLATAAANTRDQIACGSAPKWPGPDPGATCAWSWPSRSCSPSESSSSATATSGPSTAPAGSWPCCAWRGSSPPASGP
jgi:Flp pilus assembly protein TadB